ncbi:hypothetical protein ABMA28_010963 [Loxostege sticticalis]|uniref:Uncharacterized protein n=1 Tax=Loxostege sticticalis TaxID=481309 RepID=A0ABD0S7Z4_LOXSC
MDRRCSQSVRTLVFDDSDSDPPKAGQKKDLVSSVVPSSLNQSAEDAGKGSRNSNLVRMRRSALGKSAPTLSVHVKEPCTVSRRPSRLPPPPPHHRLSLVYRLFELSRNSIPCPNTANIETWKAAAAEDVGGRNNRWGKKLNLTQ